jgi:small-conductance mechanosensitive channel
MGYIYEGMVIDSINEYKKGDTVDIMIGDTEYEGIVTSVQMFTCLVELLEDIPSMDRVEGEVVFIPIHQLSPTNPNKFDY